MLYVLLGIINGGLITPTPTATITNPSTTNPALPSPDRLQPAESEKAGGGGSSVTPVVEEEEAVPLSPPQYMNSAALRNN